jgi:uncharacterized protein YbjT (DUF2867 family)
MRIAVFGASGGTGRAVVERALAEGHEVTAFVRDAAKLAPQAQLRVVTGDVMRAADVAPALQAQDAVVIALGNPQSSLQRLFGAPRAAPADVCEVGTRHILQALPSERPPYLVVVSAFGVGATRPQLPRLFRLFYWLLLREQIADKERQEALLKAAPADCAIVQPLALTDGPATGSFTARTDGTYDRLEVSRADLAAFLLEECVTRRHHGATVTLSG